MKFQIIRVYANRFNHVDVMFEKGDKIIIEADRQDKWNDLFVEAGAKGWNSFIFKAPFITKYKDMPKENLLKLCARIGDNMYPVGSGTEIIVESDGDLVLFANDLYFMRWNNTGYIDVTVKVSK